MEGTGERVACGHSVQGFCTRPHKNCLLYSISEAETPATVRRLTNTRLARCPRKNNLKAPPGHLTHLNRLENPHRVVVGVPYQMHHGRSMQRPAHEHLE